MISCETRCCVRWTGWGADWEWPSAIARDELQLSDAEFRMFSDLLRRHCGLHFGPDARFLLEKRLARRLRALEMTSFAAYHYRDSQRIGSRRRVREPDRRTHDQRNLFLPRAQSTTRPDRRDLRQELQAGRQGIRRVRRSSVWSAGCSSGEEPYSIVILAREAGMIPGKDLHVYASDISRRMLRKARQGDLPRSLLSGDRGSALRQKYFTEKGRSLADLGRQSRSTSISFT